MAQGIEYSPQELRVWYRPATWFRQTLTPRSPEEFARSPQLELRLTLALENAQVLDFELGRGEISPAHYDKRRAQLRKDLGNLLYR